MKEFHGRATAHVPAAAPEVFELITDVDRLPEWNRAIESVVEQSPELTEGSAWTVTMHPPRIPRWRSISRAETVDRDELRFAYETRNADGNPSFVKWAWRVVPDGAGADVTVTWRAQLETLDRKLLAGPMRKRQLAREVPQSLVALADALAPTSAR